MRILLASYAFAPSIGGVETVSRLLAREFSGLGHEVRLVTETPSDRPDGCSFPVIRRPSPGDLLRHLRWCEVYLHNGISLRLAWPLAFIRRPWVVTHFSWYRTQVGRRDWRARMKLPALGRSHIVGVSRAVVDDLPLKLAGTASVIHNPYDDALFSVTNHGERPIDVIFLGRLVTDKGVDVLLNALGRLRQQGIHPNACIIGDGPEAALLRERCQQLALNERVRFVGHWPHDTRLVEMLNQARIMVVPSVRNEGFGVVALEGMASGCAVVGSDNGGLPEAIGQAGMIFPTGDSEALAAALGALLADAERVARLRMAAPMHLVAHTARAIAERYVALLAEIAAG